MGGLFGGSFWGGVGEGDKITITCLIRVRIMLEISNLARKYTHTCCFRKYIS